MGALPQIMTNRQLTVYFSVYTFIAYIAISFHMNVVKRYGGVAAVLVATGRKAMTLILSFLLFPKGFSWFYPLGALLVLGGLLVSSLSKMRSHNNGGKQSTKLKVNRRDFKSHQSDVGDVETPPDSARHPHFRKQASP